VPPPGAPEPNGNQGSTCGPQFRGHEESGRVTREGVHPSGDALLARPSGQITRERPVGEWSGGIVAPKEPVPAAGDPGNAAPRVEVEQRHVLGPGDRAEAILCGEQRFLQFLAL
jgi:hypothetical protein